MEYNTFIKDTIAISKIGFGAWQLGENSGWRSMSETEATTLEKKL